MKTQNNLYSQTYSLLNLFYAFKKVRKGKSKRDYVKEFEKNLIFNLRCLQKELKNESYFPLPLKKFILRDPKTRVISKSEFRDRIIHHAVCNIIEPIFDKIFICDSCANRISKGSSFALKRLNKFKRKVTNNLTSKGFCLKADIKHYFQEIDREILIRLLEKKISCGKTLNLIIKILNNFDEEKGMPLGNLTSQFFANVYLNELDYFVKHKLMVKYYIRYVDDFIILHNSKEQLEKWKKEIEIFLRERLRLELHPDKSKIINLSKGVDFVGFRNFYFHRLIRKRNKNSMRDKIKKNANKEKLIDSFQGWNAYAKWANSFYTRKNFSRKINKINQRG